ncbi:AIPR family protein [Arcanobacterium phocae]|uniref:AIPR family protein n=1 Tax=Arcanobacterium phocae TaxID=131112 RepID=UPI001C0EBB97|nr:AIPR family protein [Arcanobacterium phocae]
MAELHLQKIKRKLQSSYSDFQKELRSRLPNDSEASIWTKTLAAHAIHYYGNAPVDELSRFVVDGRQDRGIDAVYYDDLNHQITFVQSKWSSEGVGTLISETDAGSFANGISEAMTGTFPDDSNSALLNLKGMFERVNDDYDIKIQLIVISTTTSDIHPNAKKRIEDGLERVLGKDYELKIVNQIETYQTFTNEELGGGSSFDIVLHEIGILATPYNAVYGWASGLDIADLVIKQGKNIYSRNIRGALGNTEVNRDIIQTVQDEPENFWYFNNGLTFLADDIQTPPLRDPAFARLKVTKGSIVNGAQTSSSLASLRDSGSFDANLERVRVQVRLISARNANEDEEFPRQVTRFTNSQNGVGAKEFVSLDDFQKRLQKEVDEQFARNYYIRSGTGSAGQNETGDFDLQTATIALTCARRETSNVVRAKSGIGALWKDINKPPYTEIFDIKTTTALALVKAVDAFNRIEEHLQDQIKSLDVIDEGGQRPLKYGQVARHGNRLFQHAVMRGLRIFDEAVPVVGLNKQLDKLNLALYFSVFARVIYDNYPDTYLAYLFKNQEKCRTVIEAFDREIRERKLEK